MQDRDDQDEATADEEYEPPAQAPFEAEPADAAEQAVEVPLDEDDYAPE